MSENQPVYHVEYANKKALKNAIESELVRLSKTDALNYSGPQPSLIRSLISHSQWRQNEVSEYLRVNVSTVRRWVADRDQSQNREMPYSAWILLLGATGHADIESLSA